MMTDQKQEALSQWPVVVHKTLTHPDVLANLKGRNFIVKTSYSVVPGSIIFPLSAGVAFLIVPLDQAVTTGSSHKQHLTPELLERVDKFVQSHNHCFLLCKAVIHGDTEKVVYSHIQRHYLSTRLRMMPVHNIPEAMTTMLTIAKGLCKPSEELLYSKLEKILSDQNPVMSQLDDTA